MAYRDIDLSLTEEQSFLRDMVRKFGAEFVRPAKVVVTEHIHVFMP